MHTELESLYQEKLRDNLPHAELAEKGRSWFEAWVNKYLGNRPVAQAIIR